MNPTHLRIGYIPLVDAAALIVAVDRGFAAAYGLDIELVREVSWSNVRDKLNIGLFDAAHLLTPMAIASSLGIGHVRVPIIAPFNLGTNGNAVTVSLDLHVELAAMADGALTDPLVSAKALARVVEARRERGADPLTFGMTFPFSNHNYQLRFWMAAAGVDPDEDVRLVVLPPPYMVDSLASGHVDGFCVGAPWNSVAVDAGVGRILHFGCEIMARASEKVLAVREQWAADNPAILTGLIRALEQAAVFVAAPESRAEAAFLVARRLDVAPELVARTLAGEIKIAREGLVRACGHYIVIGPAGAGRPDPVQAVWAYAQIARWGQARMADDLCARARAVFRPDLYDAAVGCTLLPPTEGPADGVGACAGPQFVADDVAGHLSAWRTRPGGRPRLSVVR
jgi:NitT/TauT family transport system ATP-binding protein